MLFSDRIFKQPSSKFVLIEDTIEVRSTELFNSIINNRTKKFKEVHLFIFEGRLSNKQRLNVKIQDFSTDIKGWLNNKPKVRLEDLVEKLTQPTVVFIDSLIHVINEYGFQQTYKWLNGLVQNKSVEIQIVAVIHQDLMEHPHCLRYLEHLSTFIISLEPKFNSENFRVSYTFKKSSGKIVKRIEEFWFENGVLKSKPIEKIDIKKLLENNTGDIIPDHLTTFKISLEEGERKAKEELILPFHPSYVPHVEESGQIFYQLDENDDWDEEDPDDDLDI